MVYPKGAASRPTGSGERSLPETQTAAAPSRRVLRAALGRAAAYFALWMVVAGGQRVDLAPGLGAAALAAWVSLRLMPPDAAGGRVRWLAALGLLAHFAHVSVLAGLDVARRALSPRIRLGTGYVHYRPQLPPSDALGLFQAMTSQLPGTIPSGSERPGTVAYHCLDVSQPVAEQLADEESRLLGALGGALGSASMDAERTRGDA